MEIQKLDAEKIMKITVGGKLCCWGGANDGCDCTSTNGSNFVSNSEVWLGRMESNHHLNPHPKPA